MACGWCGAGWAMQGTGAGGADGRAGKCGAGMKAPGRATPGRGALGQFLAGGLASGAPDRHCCCGRRSGLSTKSASSPCAACASSFSFNSKIETFLQYGRLAGRGNNAPATSRCTACTAMHCPCLCFPWRPCPPCRTASGTARWQLRPLLLLPPALPPAAAVPRLRSPGRLARTAVPAPRRPWARQWCAPSSWLPSRPAAGPW